MASGVTHKSEYTLQANAAEITSKEAVEETAAAVPSPFSKAEEQAARAKVEEVAVVKGDQVDAGAPEQEVQTEKVVKEGVAAQSDSYIRER